MKKPMNKYARLVWALLATYTVINAIYFVTSRWYLDLLPQGFALDLIRSTIEHVVEMGALAVLIELVDQIRWNALGREERSKL